jgi:hypothetical protein
MAFQKRGSQTVTKAERRLTNLLSISPYLDFGENLNIHTYNLAIDQARQKIATYNTSLAALSQIRNEAIAAEQHLAGLSERMLSGVITRYGRNSVEYEMAGGKPRGSRRKAKVSATETPILTTTIIATNGTRTAQKTRATPKTQVAQKGKTNR